MPTDDKPEPYGPPWPFDPLDMTSTVSAEEDSPELTFRQLHDLLAEEMVQWDRWNSRSRLLNQQANDPHYKPIEPYAGLKAKRRRG